MNCLIVDDEPFAREGLEHFVAEAPFLHHVGSCNSSRQALQAMEKERVDLLLLDINMPGVDGLQFLSSLRPAPLAIFCTAYSEHALEAFGLDVVDYLTKPISFTRFMQAAGKAKEVFEYHQWKVQGKTLPADYFFIKTDKGFEKIRFSELLFVKSMENYVRLQTVSKKLVSYLTLRSVEQFLSPSSFARISKSVIISIDKVDSISGNEVLLGDQRFIISRSHKDEFMALINGRMIKRL